MKKIIIFTFLIIVFFGGISKSYSIEPAPFKDVQASHSNIEAISYVKDNGIVKGYSDGTFRPDITVNRAEFIKIIVGARFGGEPISYASNCFPDVSVHDWFVSYVCYAKKAGLISGYSDGQFKPGNKINLVEAVKILVKIFRIEAPDVKSNLWYGKYIEAMQNKNYIPKSFASLDQNITRGEIAEMVWRIKEELTNKTSTRFNIIETINKPENTVVLNTSKNTICGDKICQSSESCSSCSLDCGSCQYCGDKICQSSESCSTCSSDCGPCRYCGDRICQSSESCSTCSSDCGSCKYCGDKICQSSESCSTCSSDCGPCQYCGDGACQSNETCSSCSTDCGACTPKSPVICHYKSDEEPIINQTTINLGNHQLAVKVYDETEGDISQEVIDNGFTILGINIPFFEDFFDQNYPCANLYINCAQGPLGAPGELFIGCGVKYDGFGGPFLLTHELTHSYLGLFNSPVWFAEGSAHFFADLFTREFCLNPPDFWTLTIPTGYKFLDGAIESAQELGIDLNQKVSENFDIRTQSYLGLIFLLELNEIIGKDVMSDFYADLYDQYLATGIKITQEKIKSVILSNTPSDKRSAVESLINDRLE